MTRVTTFNMPASCVSRDIFGINSEDLNDVKEPEQYKVLNFMNGFSPLYSCERGINLDEKTREKISALFFKQDPHASNFWIRCSILDITKTIFEFIFSKRSDYLLLDNAFPRLDYIKLDDGSIIVNSKPKFINFLVENKFIPKPVSQFTFNSLNSDFIEKSLQRFCKRILEKYQTDRIILLNIKPSVFYIDNNNDNIDIFDIATYNLYLKNFHLAYKLLKKYLPGCHIIDFPNFMLGNANHRWGPYTLHFQNEYYSRYLLGCIDIITNSSNRIEEECKLNQQLSNFEDYLSRRYFKTFQNNLLEILSTRNLKNLNYELSPVTLTTYQNKVVVLFVDKKVSKLVCDKKLKGGSYYPIRCIYMQNKLIFYFLSKNNTPFYINEISKNGEIKVGLFPFIFNTEKAKENMIYIRYKSAYLSARPDGVIQLIEIPRTWEEFTLS